MANLARVTIQGSMPSGEVWSINPVFSFAAPIAISTDECLAAATAIDAISIPAGLTAVNVADTKVTGCRFETRTAAGVLESVADHVRAVAIPGSAANAHPAQTSVVVSLRTSSSSATGKGRLYWPATGLTVQPTTLRFNGTQLTSFLTGMESYLALVRTAIRGVGGMNTAVLAVWSRTNASTLPVLQLRAGDVPDVQRRRRDKFIESYISVPVSAP